MRKKYESAVAVGIMAIFEEHRSRPGDSLALAVFSRELRFVKLQSGGHQTVATSLERRGMTVVRPCSFELTRPRHEHING